METFKKLFMPALIAAVFSFGIMACSTSEPTSSEPPVEEQPADEHPSGEHPSGEHPE